MSVVIPFFGVQMDFLFVLFQFFVAGFLRFVYGCCLLDPLKVVFQSSNVRTLRSSKLCRVLHANEKLDSVVGEIR